MSERQGYTEASDFLGRQVEVTVERPLGSAHPRHGWEYALNYGYVQGTLSPDGEELDAYLMGVAVPVTHFTGVCIAVIRRLDDDDDKLVVAPPGLTAFSDDDIRAAAHFQEQYFRSKIIRRA